MNTDAHSSALRAASDANWHYLQMQAGPVAVAARHRIERLQDMEVEALASGDMAKAARISDAEELAWQQLEEILAAKKAGRS